jgi:hypothetical protein
LDTVGLDVLFVELGLFVFFVGYLVTGLSGDTICLDVLFVEVGLFVWIPFFRRRRPLQGVSSGEIEVENPLLPLHPKP